MARGGLSDALRRIDDNVQRLVDTDRDHEQRLRVIEHRPDVVAQVATLAGAVEQLQRWRYAVSAALLVGGGGIGATITALLQAAGA
jgi:hypothetical protein